MSLRYDSSFHLPSVDAVGTSDCPDSLQHNQFDLFGTRCFIHQLLHRDPYISYKAIAVILHRLLPKQGCYRVRNNQQHTKGKHCGIGYLIWPIGDFSTCI